MSELSVDHIRQAIAIIKAHAESCGVPFDDALDLASHWWSYGDHNGHDNWDLLSEDVQNMWVAFAGCALREIETGEPTPEN